MVKSIQRRHEGLRFDYKAFHFLRFQRPYRRISANVEVWKTPGRTQNGLSVLAHNVHGYGTTAIVGDLIPNEGFVINSVSAVLNRKCIDL